MAGSPQEAAVVERLEAAMEVLVAGKAELGRVTGRGETAVNGWFKAKRKLPSTLRDIVDGLNALALERGVARRWTVADLLGQASEPAAAEPRAAPPSSAHEIQTRYEGELRVPLVTRIACGALDPTMGEVTVEYVSVPRHVAGPGASERNTVVYVTDGTSMAGGSAGLADGTEVVCRTDLVPRDGDVVVAVIAGAVVLRRYTGGYLVSEPTDGPASIDRPHDGDSIRAVAMGTYRRLRA